MERCYPELNNAIATAERDEDGLDYSATGQRQIREAVELERKRVWDSQTPPKEAETGIGREIQKQIDAPSVLVNRIVREAAKKRLKSKEGEGTRPNWRPRAHSSTGRPFARLKTSWSAPAVAEAPHESSSVSGGNLLAAIDYQSIDLDFLGFELQAELLRLFAKGGKVAPGSSAAMASSGDHCNKISNSPARPVASVTGPGSYLVAVLR